MEDEMETGVMSGIRGADSSFDNSSCGLLSPFKTLKGKGKYRVV